MTDEKKVLGVHGVGSTRWVGDGFHVRNLFPSNGITTQIDPFLLCDYCGPTKVAPTEDTRGAGPRPYRGLEAVTILYQGMVEHRDSLGNAGTIGPGDVHWITAGSGLVSEKRYDTEFAKQGGMLELIHLWVNLPKSLKSAAPHSQVLLKEQIPVTTLGPAGYVRVIAGEMSGVEGPAKTSSPLGIFDLHVTAGRDTELCLCAGQDAALVLLRGHMLVNETTEVQGEAQTVLLAKEGAMVTVKAHLDSTILIVSGDPLHEPVAREDAFALNTPQELSQALADYQAGKMGTL